MTDQRISELNTEYWYSNWMSSEPARDAPAARNQEVTGPRVILPEVGPPRPAADHLCHIVMANDAPINAEVELLAPTMGVNVRREQHVDALRFSMALQNAKEVCVTECERENVIVPQRVPEEVQRVERRPATVLRNTGERVTMPAAFRNDVLMADALDADAAVRKDSAVPFVWVAVKNGDVFVWPYFTRRRRRERVEVSL